MPRLITPPADEEARAIDLDALVDWCESPAFDPSCEDGLAAAAPILRALARNRHFLADAAVAELKRTSLSACGTTLWNSTLPT